MKEDFEAVKKLLDKNNVEYLVFEHEPVFTSDDAARVRGVDVKSGAKSMIVRSDGKFYEFVLSGARKIDWNKVKKMLGTKIVGLATPEEVKKVTNCEVGSVHPFGNIYGLKVYCDHSLLENEFIDFNPGLHERSIKMKSEDYIKIVEPEVVDFSK